MKKLIGIIIALVILCTLFASCKDDTEKDPESTCAATDEATTEASKVEAPAFEFSPDEWFADLIEHWHYGENGERLDVAPHDGERKCKTCRSQIVSESFGESILLMYDENEYVSKELIFDRNDKLVDGIYTSYKYNENGLLISEKSYDIEYTLMSETYYEIIEGESRISTSISYIEGIKFTMEFDMYENMIKSEWFDESGNLTDLYESEYTYNEHGQMLSSRESNNGKLISEAVYRIPEGVTERGEEICIKLIYYPEEGGKEITEYFDDGWNEKSVYAYDESGKLVTEQIFEMSADSTFSYMKTETVYNADGTKTVTEYDENGNVVS